MAAYEEGVAEEAKEVIKRAEVTAKVKERLEGLMASGAVSFGDEKVENFRGFIAPVEKFTRFLVVAGTPKTVRDQNSPTGERNVSREGDIFVEFSNGIVVLNADDLDDQKKIAWCEENSAICRDIDDPLTEAWAYMKDLQQETSTATKRLPESVDLEAILRGDVRGSRVPHSGVSAAREHKDRMTAGG